MSENLSTGIWLAKNSPDIGPSTSAPHASTTVLWHDSPFNRDLYIIVVWKPGRRYFIGPPSENGPAKIWLVETTDIWTYEGNTVDVEHSRSV